MYGWKKDYSSSDDLNDLLDSDDNDAIVKPLSNENNKVKHVYINKNTSYSKKRKKVRLSKKSQVGTEKEQIVIDVHNNMDIYHKSELVLGVERLPLSFITTYIEDLFDLGGIDKLIKEGYNVECLIKFPGH